MNFLKKEDSQGFILPGVLSAIVAFLILSGAVITVINSNLTSVARNIQSQQAFNIAEAGANYYLWHLSHNGSDFKDGQSTPSTPDVELGYGPYVHQYYDDNGRNTGSYTLWIKPDSVGSTIATIRSIGQVKNTSVKRTIETRIGAASFASYGLVSDTAFWFGNTESADGPVHSNQGIRMDGANNAEVSSSNSIYTPPVSLGGDGYTHPGVWCNNLVTTPVDCSTRSKTNWKYPVALVDFNQVSGSLCSIKKQAFQANSSTSSLANLANACSQVPTTLTNAYLPQRSTSGTYNVSRGYLIELNSSGTYNLYQVNGENDQASSYSSALTLVSLGTNISPPSSGIVFSEDNVWIRTNPNYHGRITIGAGRLASAATTANISIADDVLYSTKNGSDVIGLIAENSVIVKQYAIPQTGSFNFEIDAAMIAQTGNVGYPLKYITASSKCSKGWIGNDQNFLSYGSIASRQTWTWTWTTNYCPNAVYSPSDGAYVAGVKNNTTQYDNNLLYAPPPSFPVTTTYNILSWREVLTNP